MSGQNTMAADESTPGLSVGAVQDVGGANSFEAGDRRPADGAQPPAALVRRASVAPFKPKPSLSAVPSARETKETQAAMNDATPPFSGAARAPAPSRAPEQTAPAALTVAEQRALRRARRAAARAAAEEAERNVADEASLPEDPLAEPSRPRARARRATPRAIARAARAEAAAPSDAMLAIGPDAAPATPMPAQPSVGALANAAHMRRRHWSVVISFVLLVALPVLVSAWYLWTRAADQYASEVSFSVRTSESRSGGSDLLGRLSVFSGANSTDTDILYQFIQSQELVARLDERLNLRGLFSRHYATDPVFSFNPEATIEDLVSYWTRMVHIYYEPGNGLMRLRVQAFDPNEAQRIAQAITEESIERINDLSVAARTDATRYAREELDAALERLRNAREAVTSFRSRNQIVDPLANVQGQMGLLNTLQAQLASAMIDLDLLRETAREQDPRVTQLERRIEVIGSRIAEERSRFGVGAGGAGGDDYATLLGEFERLNVDREFAEQAYGSALLGYDMAVAEAQRTSRYLAAHIAPTLAESARYPERGLLLAGLTLFLLLSWTVGVLVYYSIRDRR